MAGDFRVTRQYIYIAGNIIDPLQNNTNEGVLYADINAAFNATTGHQHTGAPGDAPPISGSGVSLGFTQGSVLFVSPSGTFAQDNAQFFWNDSTNRLGLGTVTPASHIDAVRTTGNTQIRVTTNDNADLTASAAFVATSGGATGGDAQSTWAVTGAQSWSAGVDNSDSDNFKISASAALGTSDALGISPAGSVGIASGQRILLDGTSVGGNTSIRESSADVIALETGGSNRVTVSNTNMIVHGNSTFNTAGEVLLGDVNPPTANYLNRNSGAKAWAFVSSAGTVLNSYNISSVNRTTDGTYTVNIDTPFVGDFCVTTSVGPGVGGRYIDANPVGTNQVAITTFRVSDQLGIDASFSVACFGDQ